MFDKQAQRQFATATTEALRKQGLRVPVNPIPAVAGPTDMCGKQLKVGMKVARAATVGNSTCIKLGVVTSVNGSEVMVDGRRVKYPSRLLVL